MVKVAFTGWFELKDEAVELENRLATHPLVKTLELDVCVLVTCAVDCESR